MPSGTFEVRKSEPTRLSDVRGPQGPPGWDAEAPRIPPQARVPDFGKKKTANGDESSPPTRRDLPRWNGPVPPAGRCKPKPPKR